MRGVVRWMERRAALRAGEGRRGLGGPKVRGRGMRNREWLSCSPCQLNCSAAPQPASQWNFWGVAVRGVSSAWSRGTRVGRRPAVLRRPSGPRKSPPRISTKASMSPSPYTQTQFSEEKGGQAGKPESFTIFPEVTENCQNRLSKLSD